VLDEWVNESSHQDVTASCPKMWNPQWWEHWQERWIYRFYCASSKICLWATIV